MLEQVTGALRIYTAAMGESSPHFHTHMVPRYASGAASSNRDQAKFLLCQAELGFKLVNVSG